MLTKHIIKRADGKCCSKHSGWEQKRGLQFAEEPRLGTKGAQEGRWSRRRSEVTENSREQDANPLVTYSDAVSGPHFRSPENSWLFFHDVATQPLGRFSGRGSLDAQDLCG